MKKSKKKTWIVFCVILLLALALGWYPLRMYAETGKMSPLATQEVIKDVYVVKDSFVNFYLIKVNDGYIAVDAGNDVEQVSQAMQKLAIDPQKVIAVFLTHSDSDHVAGLKLFSRAKIYLSTTEEQMIKGETPRFGFFKNKPIAQYELLEDHQIIMVSGLNIQSIATPGHTPGAMSYMVNNAYLFVGDTISLKNGKADLFNEFFNMDSETERQSIKKLAALQNIEYVFTAHYGFTHDFRKAFGKEGE